MTCEEARRDRSSDLGNASWHQDDDCDDIGDHDDPLILGMLPSTKIMMMILMIMMMMRRRIMIVFTDNLFTTICITCGRMWVEIW